VPTSLLREMILADELRISAHRGQHFSLMVDGVSG
jgi:hypothetical protein